jgi:hypothetical protein
LIKIEINDFSLKGFTDLLNYIYCGDKTVINKTIINDIQDLEELFELYHLAEKYILTDLKLVVSTTMKIYFRCTVENYADVFKTVAKHENFPHTKEVCQN